MTSKMVWFVSERPLNTQNNLLFTSKWRTQTYLFIVSTQQASRFVCVFTSLFPSSAGWWLVSRSAWLCAQPCLSEHARSLFAPPWNMAESTNQPILPMRDLQLVHTDSLLHLNTVPRCFPFSSDPRLRERAYMSTRRHKKLFTVAAGWRYECYSELHAVTTDIPILGQWGASIQVRFDKVAELYRNVSMPRTWWKLSG